MMDKNLLSNRQRFINACRCLSVDRPPVWLMRQAGRVLPEYRELKTKHTFVEMVRTPELAAEVTLQPIRRFDFDAAIIFSDILVIPEALGQPYEFNEGAGIKMTPLQSASDIDGLDGSAVEERLDYVPQALRLVRKTLQDRTALIGFTGSPWTLGSFMFDGGGTGEHTHLKRMFYTDRPLFDRLMQKLTDAVSRYLRMQIEAGVDAVQIFDSRGGMMSDGAFAEASGKWIGEIIRSINNRVPVIVYSKSTNGNWHDLVATGAQVLGLDWTVRLSEIRALLPSTVGVQGNLDPFVLTTTPAVVAAETERLLRDMRGVPGHIFNLGHGVPPTAKLENIQTMMETIRGFV
jgi:uroporphyrinogen decarboxylase